VYDDNEEKYRGRELAIDYGTAAGDASVEFHSRIVYNVVIAHSASELRSERRRLCDSPD